MSKEKIIIIGAGPAGITAGYQFLKCSDKYDVTIIEETKSIGGISKTVNYRGNRMDIGGHRFFSKDKRVNEWWNEILPIQGSKAYDDIKLDRDVKTSAEGPDPEREDEVMLIRNRISRIYYNDKFFDYPVSLNFSTIRNMGFTTTIIVGLSYFKSVIFKRKEKSLEDFYINRFGKKLYSMFFEGYTEKLWGRHPRNISPEWGAQRVKGLSIIAIFKDIFGKLFLGNRRKNVETSLIESYMYPKFGPGQLWETAANMFIKMGGTILTEKKVTGFVNTNDKIAQVIYSDGENEVCADADYVISSMPLKNLVDGMQNVPDRIRSIADGLPYRDFVTVGVLVDKLNIKNKTKIKTLSDIVPDCWIYVQDTRVKMGRIQIFNNWSPYLVKNPENTVWMGLEYFCCEGDDMWNMSSDQWIEVATSELKKMGIIGESQEIKDAHCEKVKKAYPAYFDSYSNIDQLQNFLNEYKNLYCVGRNGQHHYNNMDHSMVTAFEAANHIIKNITTKTDIWEVNTEKNYYEEVKNDR